MTQQFLLYTVNGETSDRKLGDVKRTIGEREEREEVV